MVVAVAAGLWAVLALASLHARGGFVEAEEWSLFVQGWVLAPSFALVAVVATCGGLAPDEARRTDGLALVACADAVWLLAAAAALALGGAGAAIRVVVLLLALPVHGAALAAARRGGTGFAASRAAAPLLLCAALVVAGCAQDGLGAPPGAWLAVVLAIAVLEALRRRPAPRRPRLVSAGLLLLLALLLVDPRLPFDPFHHGWYLGPANAIRHGRVLLGDVVAAYGVLSIEFLAATLGRVLPMSYVGLALLVTVGLLVHAGVVHALLRALLASRVLAAAALFVAFAVNAGGAKEGLTVHPSAGPLRFLLPWLVPLLAVAAARRPGAARAFVAAEGIVVGVCSLWDLPTATAALGAWLGLVGYLAACRLRAGERWLAPALLRFGWGLLCIAAVHGAFALHVREAFGAWPRWQLFTDFMGAYAPEQGGLALGRAPALGGWVAVAAVYLGSLVALVQALAAAPEQRRDLRLAVICSLTLMGVAQLAYYVGWSFHSRLVKVAVPAVLVGVFWLERAATAERTRPAAAAWIAAAWVAAGAVVLAHAGLVADWIGRSALAALVRPGAAGELAPRGCPSLGACLVRGYPVYPSTRAALRLLAKHAPDVERLPVFLGSNATTELGLLVGRAHVYPITDASHDNVPAWNADRIARADPGLRAGDLVVADRAALTFEKPPVANTVPDGEALLLRLLEGLCRGYRCVEIDRIGPVTVERLEARP